MSKIFRLRAQAEIDEEAAIWAWRMDCGAGAADRQAFESWLRRDPRHRRAFDELSAVWSALDGLADAKRDERIATFAATARGTGWTARRRWWAAAAALLLAVIGAAWVEDGRESQTLATAVGQQREVTLADGSRLTLNTNTIVETDFRRRRREIYLRKGEAHFQVAHDRSRPFLVHAGDSVVRAVGTQFEVRLLSDQHVDVVVNEGRVEVQAAAPEETHDAPAANGARSTRSTVTLRSLAAGQQLSTVNGSYAVTPVSADRLSSAMAWREGAVVFDGEALSQAVSEIERYTDMRIVISDPRTAGLRVGGRFRTGDVQEFFDALQAALPVAVRRTADGVVFIDPRG